MSLRVVEDKCTEESNKLCIVLESDVRDELESMDARVMALNYAKSKGANVAGLNSFPSAYPVNSDGEMSSKVLLNQEKVAAYRCDFEILSGVFNSLGNYF
jgi:hypothetical protein